MNIDIRKYIKKNFIDDTEKEIIENIDTVCEKKADEPLIGLGVFMELLWKQSTQNEKENIAKKIKQGL